MMLRAWIPPSFRKGRLEFWIASCAAAAVAATILVVFYALYGLANEVNKIDEDLTRKSTLAAIVAFEHRLSNTVRDYATWDEAVDKLYGVPDSGFVKENYGDGTEVGVLFDTAFLIDENGHDLVRYKDGKIFDTSSRDYLGAAVEPLIAAAPNATGDYHASHGIIATADGIATVSAGHIVPFTPGKTIPRRQQRILLLAKHLTASSLADLGREFTIDGLHFEAGPGDAHDDIRLFDPKGNQIATLSWTQRSPGTIAFAKVSPAVSLMLALLTAAVAGLVIVAWRSIRVNFKTMTMAEYAAHHDYLSGLPNRIGLVSELTQETPSPARPLDEIAVAFLDLDGFKEINDAYGHKIGDQLLTACAAGFQFISKDRGVLARVGGDEFAFVANGPKAREVAREVSEQFIAFLREPFSIDGREMRIGTSVGIATASFGLVPISELLRRADIAMYEAKKGGGNRVAYYDAEIDARLQDKVSLTAGLRQAITNEEFDISYQVIVDAASHEPRAVEALIRWTTPDGRQIAPDDFIPLAEDSGLIDELGMRVLRRACRDALPWGDIQLAVNVSPIQFRNPAFEGIVAEILRETNFPPRRLELEFTERHLLSEFDRAFDTMTRLRNRGIALSLDDFGTGYSSVGYLRRFRFDRLKIDQSICAGIATDTSVQHLIQGTIAIARSMDLSVIAEGVENEYQAQLLRLAGCAFLQGHFFGQPVPPQMMGYWLRRYESKRTVLAG